MSTALLRYFWTGYAHSIDRHGTIADYPGAPSCYGARNDAIEGVTRLLPLWAAAYSSPLCANELRAPMGEALVRALTHGCDPGHPGYWGSIGPRSTLICEAADVALAVWLVARAALNCAAMSVSSCAESGSPSVCLRTPAGCWMMRCGCGPPQF